MGDAASPVSFPPTPRLCGRLLFLYRFATLRNKLVALYNTHLLSVTSVGRKSGHSVTGLSAQGLTGLHGRCQRARGPHWGTRCSSRHLRLQQNSSPYVAGLTSCLLAGCRPGVTPRGQPPSSLKVGVSPLQSEGTQPTHWSLDLREC